MSRALVAALVAIALSICGLSVVSGAPTRVEIDGEVYDIPDDWISSVEHLFADDAQPDLSGAAPATDVEGAEQHVQVSQAWTEDQSFAGALGNWADVRFPVPEQHFPVAQAWSEVQNGGGASFQAGGSSQETLPVALVGHAHYPGHADFDNGLSALIRGHLEEEHAVKTVETWRDANPHSQMHSDMLNALIKLHARIARGTAEVSRQISRKMSMYQPYDDLQKELDAKTAMQNRLMAASLPR